MAKNTKKNKKPIQKFNIHKNPKLLVGIAVVAVLLFVVGILLVNRSKDATAGTTSTSDLAKSEINTNNTKDTKAKAATEIATPENASGSSASGTKKSSTSNTSTTNTPAASGSSGSSAPSSTPDPFSVDSGIYSTIDNSSVSIGCNEATRFTFTAYIEATGAGTATYHWERSDGAVTSNRQAVFTGTGTVVVTNTWDLSSDSSPGSYEVYGWQKVVVTSPNETSSKADDADFTLSVNCS